MNLKLRSVFSGKSLLYPLCAIIIGLPARSKTESAFVSFLISIWYNCMFRIFVNNDSITAKHAPSVDHALMMRDRHA